MRRLALLALLAGVGLAGIGEARADGLGVGDPAPKLDVKEFVKGEPVKEFQPGKLYVVDVWATWCGPCRQAIPHLTELQKKHPDVAFIGVSAWERDQKKVKPFVDEMGEKMNYRVALDNVPENESYNQGPMVQKWMLAADRVVIPMAFVIDGEGRIAWIGDPSGLDGPLEKIIDGEWDIRAAAAADKRARQERAEAREERDKTRKAEKGTNATP